MFRHVSALRIMSYDDIITVPVNFFSSQKNNNVQNEKKETFTNNRFSFDM